MAAAFAALGTSCSQKETEVAPKASVTITDTCEPDYDKATLKCSVSGNVSAERLVIEYSKNQSFGGATKKTFEKSADSFTITLEGLEIQTTYFYRYTVENKVNSISDDKVRQFKTKDYTVPLVTTGAAKDIAAQAATIEGTMNFACGKPILEQGFYFGTDKNSLTTKTVSTSEAAFSLTVDNLVFGQKYFYQAYAKTEIGTGKGEVLEFTTLNGVPSITTEAANNISTASATLNGAIESDGGAVITERGFCYANVAAPTVNSTKVVIAGTIGEISKDITELQPATRYYVRVFAVNAKGTHYGNDITFETDPIRVSSVSLNETTVELKQNQTVQLVATVSPSDATYPTVSWQSSAPSVVSVSGNGLVTALAEGEAIITATADGKSATCKVVVSNTASGGHEGTGESEWE